MEITYEELDKKMKEKYNNFEFTNNKIEVLDYTESGRVKEIQIGNIKISGTEIRNILGLKSTNFTVKYEDNLIKFDVIGYGHGVRNEPVRS